MFPFSLQTGSCVLCLTVNSLIAVIDSTAVVLLLRARHCSRLGRMVSSKTLALTEDTFYGRDRECSNQ